MLTLTALVWPARAQAAAAPRRAERPTYTLGEKWLRDDGAYELVRIEEDRYIFVAGPEQEIHLTKDLAIAKVRQGQAAFEWDPPPRLAWPLEVGKWGSGETRAIASYGPTRGRLVWSVEAYETVRVPARAFQAFRLEVVETFGAHSSKLRLWYAPEARQYVKAELTGPSTVVSQTMQALHTFQVVAVDHPTPPDPARVAVERVPLAGTGTGTARPEARRSAATGSGPSALYGESWAVLIGINRYQHPRIPKLRYAVNDAKAVERALLAQGFRPDRIVTLTEDQATKAAIERLLGDQLRQQVGETDRLLVFFAGHGKTDRLRSGEEEGYLIPVDGDPNQLFSTAISMTALRQISDRLTAKHILYIVDACYSGYAIFNRAIADDLLAEMVKKPAIQILTAGRQQDEAQERAGHGVFTDVLVRGLSGDAFAPGKSWLALEELGVWVKARVFAESNKKQLPQYGNLSGEGQFVFVFPGRPAELPGGGSAGTDQPPVIAWRLPPAPLGPPPSMLTGDLDLTSDPSGATVRLDGREVGTTPLTLERVPVGEHSLDLDKDGLYAARKSITIAANTLDRLSVKLDRRKGKLTVFSEPRDARVLLDGKDLGSTPVSLEVEAGPYTLRLTKEGYKAYEETLTLPADKETRTRIALRATRGTLEVTSTPLGATVELGGAPRGQTPLTLPLEEGTYPLRLRLPRHKTEARQAEIAGERITRLQVALTPAGPGHIERRGNDDAEMVFIPAGRFTMGDTHGNGDRGEQPVHQVGVEAFWLDRTEVTNAQFTRFVQAGARIQGFWRSEYTTGKEQHPVFNVTWYDAAAYCAWAGKRLPTEAEWEYAARGTDGRRYPWGDTWDTSKANGNFQIPASTPVGSYAGGASPFGVHDLAGNVWEWTSTLYKPYPYSATDGREDATASGARVFRGGAWDNAPFYLRSASRLRVVPSDQFNYLGFRCAQDATQ
jgi:formylglycine-generating enzyme required for sulfatase activity